MKRVGDIKHVSVSAVIPTRGRSAVVLTAIHSALEQTYPVLEVVVVVDGPDEETCAKVRGLRDSRVRLVTLKAPQRAGGARNAGVAEVRGDFVAFLDDDDSWRPDKIALQVAALPRGPQRMRTVVSCQAEWHTGTDSFVWPTRGIRVRESVADYLFVRRHAGEGVLATPTLLLSADLARSCPMPTHLHTHEDWDWLLNLEEAGAVFRTVLRPLADVDARPRRTSVSNSANWRHSLAWGLSRADAMGPRAFSGFVLTEVARSAVLERAELRVHHAIAAAAFTGRPRPRDLLRFLGRPVALHRLARKTQ